MIATSTKNIVELTKRQSSYASRTLIPSGPLTRQLDDFRQVVFVLNSAHRVISFVQLLRFLH
jgi:hypothetical protein